MTDDPDDGHRAESAGDGEDHEHPPPGDHEHHDHDHDRRRRPPMGTPSQFFTNWNDYEASVATKLWLTLRNRAKAYADLSRLCCGHPGEPGC